MVGFPFARSVNSRCCCATSPRSTRARCLGSIDRYNMKREITLTANLAGIDLGLATRDVTTSLQKVANEAEQIRQEKIARGEKPATVTSELRGQIPPLRQMLSGLGVGLVLAVLVIFLLLSANFQSWRLALVTVSTAPAVIAGVVLALWLTGTTLNIQSFIGAIMAIGVAMANAILLVTFAEQTASSDGQRPRGGERKCVEPAASDLDDELRDDGRHAADGAGARRGRAADCAAGPGRDRRTRRGDAGHVAGVARCLCPRAGTGQPQLGLARSSRS